jgi:hypothetical protein
MARARTGKKICKSNHLLTLNFMELIELYLIAPKEPPLVKKTKIIINISNSGRDSK